MCDRLDGDGGSGLLAGANPTGGLGHPTVADYEEVIGELQSKNSKQAHELLQIKADLRDVLYSHKWTPDAFLMAKAYVSEDTQASQSSSTG